MTARRVAVVHERFTEYGGSERVAEELVHLFPGATLFAALVDDGVLPASLAGEDVRPSALQRLYRGGTGYAQFLPMLGPAMARLDLREFDVVVTSHSAFANRVRPPAHVPVVSYTHTPARWMWEPGMLRHEIGGIVGRSALRAFSVTQRRADAVAAQRASSVVANSAHVASRIRRWWKVEAEVVHPPVDVDWYTVDPTVSREDFFLLAGRLVPYKRPEIAVAAARRAGVRLVVAGDGRSRSAVEQAAGPTTEVIGRVDARTLRDLYRRCRGLVFPGEEDFGMVPVEAQACGTPVVALGVGGVLDSVIDGTTGVLYAAADADDGVEALARALRAFDTAAFDTAAIRRHAETFSPARFGERMVAVVDAAVQNAEASGRR